MNWTIQNTDAWEPRGPDDDSRPSEPSGSRRWLLVLLSAAVVAVGAIAYLGYHVFRWLLRPIEYVYGGVWCSEVVAQWDDFRAGKLSRDSMERITEHLAKCPVCSKMVRRIQPTESRSLERGRAPAPRKDDS